MLKALYRDWEASPISGTAAIFCAIAAGVCLATGNVDRCLLYAILGTLMLIGRKDDVR